MDTLGWESSELKNYRNRILSVRENVQNFEQNWLNPVENSLETKEVLKQAISDSTELNIVARTLSKNLTDAMSLVTQRKTFQREKDFDRKCEEIVTNMNDILRSISGQKIELRFTREDLFESIYSYGPNERLVMLKCTFRPLLFIVNYVKNKSYELINTLRDMNETNNRTIRMLEDLQTMLDEVKELTRI